MIKKKDLELIQNLWNCGYTDKEMLDLIKEDLSLEEIKEAREKLGLYKNK